jgi:hypothetical protein
LQQPKGRLLKRPVWQKIPFFGYANRPCCRTHSKGHTNAGEVHFALTKGVAKQASRERCPKMVVIIISSQKKIMGNQLELSSSEEAT